MSLRIQRRPFCRNYLHGQTTMYIPHILNRVWVPTTSLVCIILANSINGTDGQSNVLFKPWENLITHTASAKPLAEFICQTDSKIA